jgi:multiple sugar transport system ATP-binding protein
MATIELQNVTKRYGSDVVAVDDLSLSIGDGEFMVLVGPSGCGKSTLMRLVAGLERATAGRILIGSEDVTDDDPQDRDIAMVFQNYALYPHMTVETNLAFGLKIRKTPRDERDRRVAEAARILGLEPLLKRKPAQLSGGQRQRVAMGRAMVREPQAFLMDEPLSNLDAKLRVQMRAELARLSDRLKTTTLYVTHDQVEAMTLGHRVAVMRDGLLQQVDSPQALYHWPTNLFVATFIGSPSMNLVEATFDEGELRFADVVLPAPDWPELGDWAGRKVILGIRPTSFEDASVGQDHSRPVIETVPDVVEELGSEIQVVFTVEAQPVTSDATQAALGDADEGRLVYDEGAVTTFTATLRESTRASPGRPLRLTVDTGALYLFDPRSGQAIRDLAVEPMASRERV